MTAASLPIPASWQRANGKSLFWVHPFLCTQEKGNAACGLLIEWKFILQKWVSWTAYGLI